MFIQTFFSVASSAFPNIFIVKQKKKGRVKFCFAKLQSQLSIQNSLPYFHATKTVVFNRQYQRHLRVVKMQNLRPNVNLCLTRTPGESLVLYSVRNTALIDEKLAHLVL